MKNYIENKYDASCIRVLSDSEALEIMPWLAAETLAAKYGKDVSFIERGLLACHNAGVNSDYFINRYLEGDKSIPINREVDCQSRILQRVISDNETASKFAL